MTIIASVSGAWNTVQHSIRGLNASTLAQVRNSIQMDCTIAFLKQAEIGNFVFRNRFPITGSLLGAACTSLAVRRACWYSTEATYQGAPEKDVSLRTACQLARDDLSILTNYILKTVVEFDPSIGQYRFRPDANRATVIALLEGGQSLEGAARNRLGATPKEIQSKHAVRALLEQLQAGSELQILVDSCQDPEALGECKGIFREFLENLRPQLCPSVEDTNANIKLSQARGRLHAELNGDLNLDRYHTVAGALNQTSDAAELQTLVGHVRGHLLGLDQQDVLISIDELNSATLLEDSLHQARETKELLESCQTEEDTDKIRHWMTQFLQNLLASDKMNDDLKAACLVDVLEKEPPEKGDPAAGAASICTAYEAAAPDRLPPLATATVPMIDALYQAIVKATAIPNSSDMETVLGPYRGAFETYHGTAREHLLQAVDSLENSLARHPEFQGDIADQIKTRFRTIGIPPREGTRDSRLTTEDPLDVVQRLHDSLLVSTGAQPSLMAQLNADRRDNQEVAHLRNVLQNVDVNKLLELQDTLSNLIARATLGGGASLSEVQRNERNGVAQALGSAAQAAHDAALAPQQNTTQDQARAATLYTLQQKTDATFRGLQKWGYLGLWSWAVSGMALGAAIWTAPRWAPGVRAFYQNAHRRLFQPIHLIGPAN